MKDTKTCEMCGKQTTNRTTVETENSTLKVCKSCSTYGKKKVKPKTKKVKKKRKTLERDEKMLKQDYPRIIRDERNKLGKSQKELSKELNIKRSVLKKIENGDITPDEDVVKKLENKLNVNLYTEADFDFEKEDGESDELTLGDIADIK